MNIYIILTLFLKLIIIVVTLIFLPLYYLYFKTVLFVEVAMVVLLSYNSIYFLMMLIFLKITFIIYITYICSFLAVIDLFLLIILIHFGIVY